MKRSFYALGLMLAATFTLTNCAKEIDSPVQEPESAGIPFEIMASAVDTKTTNNGLSTVWAEGDALNVFHAEAGAATYVNNGQFTYGVTENGNFAGTLAAELTAEAYDWYAFYPYSSYIKTPANTSSGYMPVGSKSNAVQTQTGNDSMAHIAGENYPMWGIAENVAVGETPTITMTHLTSLIAVEVINEIPTGDDLTVESVSFTAPEGVDIVGTYYIDFSTSTPSFKSSGANYVSSIAKLSVEEGTPIAVDESAKFYIAVKPFTAEAGATLELNVNGYSKTLTLQNDAVFAPGKFKNVSFAYDQDVVEKVPTEGIASIYETVTSTVQGTPDEIYVNLEDAVVTYVNGNNAYLEDATGGILIYKSGHGLVAGDKLSGVMSGTAYIRYGVHQIISFDLTDITKTEGAEIPSTTLTVDELLADYASYVSRRVVIEGATVVDGVSTTDRNGVVNQNGTAINLYAGANNIVTFTYGANVDFACYPTYYNSTKQVSVWENPTVNPVCAVPEISYENNLVSITCPTEGVTIYYTTDGNDPTTSSDIYSEPFEISATCTVKAYAVMTDWQDSEVATLECVYSSVTTVTETIELTATAQGYVNAQEVTSVSSDNVTINFNKGTNSNTPKYYTSGTAVRVYGGGYFVVESDKTIVKIELTFGTSDGSNALTTDVGTFASPIWTGSASSVKFTVGGTSGHRRIKSVAVTYQN